jgi:hypothetical protein
MGDLNCWIFTTIILPNWKVSSSGTTITGITSNCDTRDISQTDGSCSSKQEDTTQIL